MRVSRRPRSVTGVNLYRGVTPVTLPEGPKVTLVTQIVTLVTPSVTLPQKVATDMKVSVS
jgi:hypothetical protein